MINSSPVMVRRAVLPWSADAWPRRNDVLRDNFARSTGKNKVSEKDISTIEGG